MWSPKKADWYYGLSRWGMGYFCIHNEHLAVIPTLNDKQVIDVYSLLNEVISKYNLRTPILFRFPQIITTQVRRLFEAFDHIHEKMGYTGLYKLAYPMKVNQRKHVLDAILTPELTAKGRVGLETGTKAELAIALSRNPPFIVCNGFMDRHYTRMALLGSAIRDQIYLIINHLADTRTIIEEWESLTATLNSKGIKFNPQLKLGIRLRLHPTGGGKWIKSGGEAARFGLKTYEIIDAVEMLEKAKLLSKIEVLHFHLGSQIPGLEGIVNTIKEGMIVARDLKSIGLPIRIIDLGGGLPVDYDATRSSSEYSASYDYGDYANAVVSTLVEMCNKFDISHMDILSESGRFVTAHHAFLVTNIRSVMRAVYGDIPSRNVIPPSLPPPIHKKVTMLFDLFETLQKMKPMDSYLDIYQEAHRLRESLIRDFREGKITFRLMATIDRLFFYMIKEVMDLAMRDYERIDLSFKHIVS
ncbi:MAG: biosynthetic arginine decarboxylase, partial [Candidatus Bathyarchaeia archaeon]